MNTAPGSNLLLVTSVAAILALFSLSYVVVIAVAVSHNWPEVKIMNMPDYAKASCLAAILGCYFVLLAIRCQCHKIFVGDEETK